MKTLLLLRHAKSSWDDPSRDDFDRPLAPRGRKAAPRMGAYLRARGIRPDLTFCSAARRARETGELVAAALGEPPPAKILRAFYAAPSDRLLAALRALPDAVGSVLLIGHNPELEQLAARLAGPGSDRDALDRMRRKFPTAALAIVEFAGPWPALGEAASRLVEFVRPKDLAGAAQSSDQKGSLRR